MEEDGDIPGIGGRLVTGMGAGLVLLSPSMAGFGQEPVGKVLQGVGVEEGDLGEGADAGRGRLPNFGGWVGTVEVGLYIWDEGGD